jgi:hypothetical protein
MADPNVTPELDFCHNRHGLNGDLEQNGEPLR